MIALILRRKTTKDFESSDNNFTLQLVAHIDPTLTGIVQAI
jgi:hypothetical protein